MGGNIPHFVRDPRKPELFHLLTNTLHDRRETITTSKSHRVQSNHKHVISKCSTCMMQPGFWFSPPWMRLGLPVQWQKVAPWRRVLHPLLGAQLTSKNTFVGSFLEHPNLGVTVQHLQGDPHWTVWCVLEQEGHWGRFWEVGQERSGTWDDRY